MVKISNQLINQSINQPINQPINQSINQSITISTDPLLPPQAPEMLLKSSYDPRQLDLWSLGAVLYTMVIGKLPHGRLKTEEEARSLKPLAFPAPSVMILTPQVK